MKTKNTYTSLLLFSAMSLKGQAMEATPLDDMTHEQQQKLKAAKYFTQTPMQSTGEAKSEALPVPSGTAAAKKTQPLKKEQGNLERIEAEHGVTQAFGKARAIEEVTQGNITESHLGGDVEQSFKSARAGEKVSQGNVANTKIKGAITQTFGDDEEDD